MNLKLLIYPLLALLSGVAVTFQAPINAKLSSSLKSDSYATFTAFLVGTIILAIYLAVSRESIPSLVEFKNAPWWSYLGAITGIIYVFSLIIVIPKLGIANTTVLMLVAQIVMAILLDSFGAFGTAIRPITLLRGLGAVLMMVGVYLVNKF